MFKRNKTISAAIISGMSRIPLTERYEKLLRDSRRGLMIDKTSHEDAVAKRTKLENRIERLRLEIELLDGKPKERRFFDWKHLGRYTSFDRLLGDELYQAELELFNVKLEEESTRHSIQQYEERIERMTRELEQLQLKADQTADKVDVVVGEMRVDFVSAADRHGVEYDPKTGEIDLNPGHEAKAPAGLAGLIRRQAADAQDRRDASASGLSAA